MQLLILLVALFAFALAKPEAAPGVPLGGRVIGSPVLGGGLGSGRIVGGPGVLSRGLGGGIGGGSLGGHGRAVLH